ncbi:hypothetical protein JCM3766R1_004454 [Sporobolomyces carnicolor]
MSCSLPPTYTRHTILSTQASRRLHPYLGARARLSLSWLSQHFLALLLVLVALAFVSSSVSDLVKDGKRTLTAACAGVEGAANVAASLPHYMADGVNQLNSNTVTAVTHGVGTVLDLTLQALEAIIIFMIDTYRSLFLCLLDLAVHGSLTLLVQAIEQAQEFVTEALSKVREGIQGAIGGINSGLEKSIGLIDKIPGVNVDIPTIDIPELSALENVPIPSTVVDALTELNSSIPTLDEFRAAMNSLISDPIEALRTNVNATLSNRTIEVELLPVPARQTVDVCTGLDTTWIDDVGDDLGKFVRVAIAVVIGLMIFFILACAVWERYSYRNFIGGVVSARETWIRDLVVDHRANADGSVEKPDLNSAAARDEEEKDALSIPNLLSFLNASSHPTLCSLLRRAHRFFSIPRTSDARANSIWFCSYIAHPNAWCLLAFGLAGCAVVQVQLWLLHGPVRHVAMNRANEGAGQFSNSVVASLNTKMNESSFDFASKSNAVILSFEDGINQDLFGWVNGTTEALNSTITGFYDGLTGAITDVFDGTILEDPILNLVYCLVGSKVDAISHALTWMHSHAHVSLPTVASTVLVLDPDRSRELAEGLTSPDSSVSAVSVVDKMLRSYERALEQQLVGFVAAVGLWGLVVVFGLVGIAWRSSYGDDDLSTVWSRRGRRREPGQGFKGPTTAAVNNDDDDEKKTSFSFKPLHLRMRSTVSTPCALSRGRSSPPVPPPQLVASPPTPIAANDCLESYSFPRSPLPLPPPLPICDLPRFAPLASNARETPRGSIRPSAASWASLVDFFRPTTATVCDGPTETASTLATDSKKEKFDTSELDDGRDSRRFSNEIDGDAPRRRPRQLDLPTAVPRAFFRLSSSSGNEARRGGNTVVASFTKPRAFETTSSRVVRSSSRACDERSRRDSDLVDLRTGRYLVVDAAARKDTAKSRVLGLLNRPTVGQRGGPRTIVRRRLVENDALDGQHPEEEGDEEEVEREEEGGGPVPVVDDSTLTPSSCFSELAHRGWTPLEMPLSMPIARAAIPTQPPPLHRTLQQQQLGSSSPVDDASRRLGRSRAWTTFEDGDDDVIDPFSDSDHSSSRRRRQSLSWL